MKINTKIAIIVWGFGLIIALVSSYFLDIPFWIAFVIIAVCFVINGVIAETEDRLPGGFFNPEKDTLTASSNKVLNFFIFIGAGLLIILLMSSDFMQQDICLDGGGRWNNELKQCEFDEAHASKSHSYKFRSGYVPDEHTAMKIAEAILIPVYGEKKISEEKPLKAELKDGVWTVNGTLHCPKEPGCKGGVAVVEIAEDNGRILRVSHGK